MADLVRRSPLEGLEAGMAKASWEDAMLEPVPFLAQTVVRASQPAQHRLEATLGISLLGAHEFTTATSGDVLRLGPDEWMIVGPDGSEDAVQAKLRAAVGEDGAVISLGGNGAGLLLRGGSARDVLATCCALDFHPRVFTLGHCAATLLAKAPVIIQQLDAMPTYRILLRPSLAAYVVGWLVEGMTSVRASSSS